MILHSLDTRDFLGDVSGKDILSLSMTIAFQLINDCCFHRRHLVCITEAEVSELCDQRAACIVFGLEHAYAGC